MSTPYYYRIQDLVTLQYYIGAKWGADADPSKFWKDDGYQTSSSIVHSLVEEHGLDRFRICKIFITNNAQDYERRILSKVNARLSDNYLNSCSSPKYNNHSMSSEEARLRVSEAVKATRNDPKWKATKGKEAIQKTIATISDPQWKATKGEIRKTRVKQTFSDPEWVSTVGEQRKEKISSTKNNPVWKETIGEDAKRKWKETIHSPEWKATVGLERSKKISEKLQKTRNDPEWKAKVSKVCPYCGKSLDPANYSRYHGDKCKARP